MILRTVRHTRPTLGWLALLLGGFGLACGGTGGTGSTASTTTGGGGGGGNGHGGESSTVTGTSAVTGTGGMMMAGAIPDPGPGSQVDQDFTEKEPNDTPETATPLGTTASASGINVWVTSNQLGGTTDAADYFVFKSGTKAGAMSINICFSAPITEMTATLWKVVNAKAEQPPIGTWTSVGTCVQGPAMGVPLEVSTTYLFGLTAKGDVATYNA
ncbi:MAG: hypothetical protein ABJE95_02070 [Byssovorax sp.]